MFRDTHDVFEVYEDVAEEKQCYLNVPQFLTGAQAHIMILHRILKGNKGNN